LKKMMNKKYVLIPISIVLMVTMLMIPMANATTAYVASVINSSGVTNPDNVKGTSTDGQYAIMDGAGSMLIVKMTTKPNNAITVHVKCYAYSMNPVLNVYYGTSSAPSNYAGYKNINSGATTDYTFSIPAGNDYFGFHNQGGSLYIDQIYTTY